MIEEYIQKLAEAGILGILLVIALVAIFTLYKECKTERDARLEDLKAYTSDDKKFIVEIKAILEQILNSIKGDK